MTQGRGMARILVAEDSLTQAEELRWILEAGGFEVEVARDGDAALALYGAGGGFDLVVSDIVMPGRSGYELCREIKSNNGRFTPVVLLSSLGDPMDIIRGLECGADNFITKPYEPEQLLSRIRTVLENRRLRASGRMQISGVEVAFLGRTFTVTSDKEQILDLLISTFEDIVRTNRGLQQSQAELAVAKAKLEEHAQQLEERVAERTAQIARIQEQLSRSQRIEALGQLTGGLAHDFNNLLAIVIGNLDLLAGKLESSPDAAALAEDALRASLRGSELTRQLLAFSRKQPLEPRLFDLNKVVQESAKLLSRTLGSNIELRTVESPAPALILADEAQTESAIVNLAVNAKHAMPNGGRLTFEIEHVLLDDAYTSMDPEVTPGPYICLTVSDSGVGIPAEIIHRVFEPFFTTKEAGIGTGLGLSQVYGFFKQSGGTAKIYSEVGRGTTIRLYFPDPSDASSDAAAIRAQSSEDLASGRGELVLLVDDNSNLRQLVLQQLVQLGYRGIEASDARSALAMLEQHSDVRVLFADVVMPGLSGDMLAQEAVARRPGLKVLLTSGFPGRAMEAGNLKALKFPLLPKPYRKAALAAKLREVIGARSPA
jgi:signal transduction histidine kinase